MSIRLFTMAADNNHRRDSEIENNSVASHIKGSLRQDLIKKLLEDSFQNTPIITNDALNLVVEVANCIVIETCMRAANRAMKNHVQKVNHEHVQECLPQLMLDFP